MSFTCFSTCSPPWQGCYDPLNSCCRRREPASQTSTHHPQRISTDNDPLFQYHRWKANLRVLEIEEVKSLPHAPMSHPFVERLIGSIRRELLDQTLFWTATDLQRKLHNYQHYYNESRTHSGRNGATPIEPSGNNVADISDFRWKKHCRGLFELPVTA